MNSIEILDLAWKRLGIDSDNKLAKATGIDRARISQYRTGTRKLDEAACLALADAIGVPPAYLLALVAAERARDERAAQEWRRAATLLKKGAAAMVATVLLGLSAPHPAEAAQARVAIDGYTHYARLKRRDAAGPDPRADRSPGYRRRRRRARRADGRSALTVTALTDRRAVTERRVTDRPERDRRHGTATP